MQRPDEKKRQLIVAAAARMFASRPYHKVRLDEIAAAAKIGKGTVYIYFENKEELYFSLIFDGFAQLVDGLREQLAPAGGGGRAAADGSVRGGHPASAADGLRRAVDALVAFAYAHPHVYEVMRNVGDVKRLAGAQWTAKRQELIGLLADTIRRGVRAGEMADPSPELTAACLGGMVRSARLFGPPDATAADVAAQIYRLLTRGILLGGPDGGRDRDGADGRDGAVSRVTPRGRQRGVVREGKR